ncbi:MAG: hypothetical protein IPI67_36115 [Myxococcales bacterium]|nr:hypothetical protein [Myxococcales bacterium]
MRRFLAATSFIAVSGTAPLAAAVENDWDGDFGQKAERRSDFTAGVSFGLFAANAYGYPNEARKIGNDAYVADTGLGVGTARTYWIGGALRDWFTFGVGYWDVGYSAKTLDASGFGVVFRVETFPFWAYGGKWRDAGVQANFGIGGMKLEEGADKRADGGALSIVGLGAFWEPVRFSIFSFGPNIEYTHLFSRTLSLYGTTVGARLVLYTRP